MTNRNDEGTEDSVAEGFRAQSLGVSLTVKDVRDSLRWYRDVVGFAVDQEHLQDGQLRAVSLTAGEVRFIVNQDDGAKGWDRRKGEGLSLYLTTEQDVDTIAARIEADGTELVSQPADMPWGVRAFTVLDPDGFKLVIARPA
ncbi:MAG TPA: VOC family protein [Longimicrobiales bacterium]|nr:VOC family protein [Longimicrobiales bacterium]